ncbi:MAG: flagellar motor switch phosphatase FliY [Verrucomicrobiota bacterium]
MGNPSIELPANLEVLLDIPVKVTVELGACQMSMQEVLQLGPGSILPLDKPADTPVDLFVNQKLVARGEVVVMEDQFGIRITEVLGRPGQTAATPAPAATGANPAAPRATTPADLSGKTF